VTGEVDEAMFEDVERPSEHFFFLPVHRKKRLGQSLESDFLSRRMAL
jgi:hypothetical protein